LVRWLRIKANPELLRSFGEDERRPLAFVHGSSLAFEGLDWDQICKTFGIRIRTWASLGSSPCEWEALQHRAPEVSSGFVVVSPYDLNEYWLCDFRADIVPFVQTIQDLHQCAPDWAFTKRILSQYPQALVRKIFPTVGRSDGVMVGLRAKLRKLTGGAGEPGAGEAPRVRAVGREEVRERLTDWAAARVQRHIALFRATCLGKHSFDGPKKLALIRLLKAVGQRGRATLVVVPVSPLYAREFLDGNVMSKFEEEIEDVRRLCPGVRVVRLDLLAALHDNALYYDFMHLNAYGQEIATRAFLTECSDWTPSHLNTASMVP